MARETIVALTSLSPAPASVPVVRDCVRSWRNAGLDVRAFNHSSEIDQLRRVYDVEFVSVAETTMPVFGRHFVPITAMVSWASKHNGPVLLLNSDINLQLADWEVKRIRWLSDDGLCYLVRYNHSGVLSRAAREAFGIDAFLFHGRHALDLPASFLSMGQPFWDYWLPHAFACREHPIYTVEFPAGFHMRHQLRWSWDMWHRCALEFARITGQPGSVDSFEACIAMSVRVRQGFDNRKIQLPHQPQPIAEWVRRTFGYRGPKVFLELGAHRGDDTSWLAQIPDVFIHAFEPDPRNHQLPRENVVLHREAIADRDGPGHLILSREGWGQEWTHSSSIKPPKNHLHYYPVTFGEAVDVQLMALDTFYERQELGVIDFIWADIQGAEGEMVRGGRRALANTRYLYTEYSDDELYEDQATLQEILALLPGFRVVELWPEDVLLENRRLAR
jgi:FkbM family methyltransferase